MIIAFSPLAHGLLSGRSHKRNAPVNKARAGSLHFQPEAFARAERLIEVLREVAAAHGRHPGADRARLAIRHPAVVAIPGASSAGQLESNAAAAEIDLAADEDPALRAASSWPSEPVPQPSGLRGKISAARHCARCGKYLAKTLWQDLRCRTGTATALDRRPDPMLAPLAQALQD
jgi:hypothetical protein